MKNLTIILFILIFCFGIQATEYEGNTSDSIMFAVVQSLPQIDSSTTSMIGNDTINTTIYCSDYNGSDSIIIYYEGLFQDTVTADSIVEYSITNTNLIEPTVTITLYTYYFVGGYISDTQILNVATGVGNTSDSIMFLVREAEIKITSPSDSSTACSTSINIITEQYGFDGDSIDYWVNDTIVATNTGVITIDSKIVDIIEGSNTITVWVYENRGFGAGGFGEGYFGVGYDGYSDSITVFYETICPVTETKYTKLWKLLKHFDRRLRRW